MSVGNIFRSREKHIVFPVSDRGYEPEGSARMVFSRWPGLVSNGKLRPEIPILEDGRRFYPLVCYSHSDGNSWEKTPKILEAFLKKGLKVSRRTRVGVILPGSSEMEKTWGANASANYNAVRRAAKNRKIVLYADYKTKKN